MSFLGVFKTKIGLHLFTLMCVNSPSCSRILSLLLLSDMVNYYNISVALGRRSNDFVADRLGAYQGSEINPSYFVAVQKLRRQCDFDKDQNCTKDAHMCHYITPQHMKFLSSSANT